MDTQNRGYRASKIEENPIKGEDLTSVIEPKNWIVDQVNCNT